MRRDPKKLWPMGELRWRLQVRLQPQSQVVDISQWSDKQRKSAQYWLEKGGQMPDCVKKLPMSPYAEKHDAR